MAHLIKHALRASAGAFDSYTPTGWSPRLKAVVMGPVGADQELVWTVTKPDGKEWFEQRASVNELADDEMQSFELSYWESEGDSKAAGDCAFTLRLVQELDGVDDLLHEGVLTAMKVDELFEIDSDWTVPLALIALDVDDAPPLRVTTFYKGVAEAYAMEAHCFKDGKRFSKASDLSGGHTFTNSKGEPVGAEIIATFDDVRGWNNLTGEGWGEDSWHLLDGNDGTYEVKFLRDGKVARVVAFDVADGRIVKTDRIEPDYGGRPTMWAAAAVEGKLDGKVNKKSAAAYGDVKTAAIEWDSDDMYRQCKGSTATAGSDDQAETKGPEMDDDTTEALQAYIDRAERLLQTWEAETKETDVDDSSMSNHLLQLDAVIREMPGFEEKLEAVSAVPDDHAFELLGETTNKGDVAKRVRHMAELAQKQIDGDTKAGEDALAPYRELLAGDKLAVFEDHPAPDFLYYTTNKKVIETPKELAAAKFWYFEGSVDIKGTAEVDGKKVKVTVDGWRVLGWKFDAKGKTLDEFEEQGEGTNAPKTAFKHK